MEVHCAYCYKTDSVDMTMLARYLSKSTHSGIRRQWAYGLFNDYGNSADVRVDCFWQ